ncbi:MAG TPA: SAM-dependent methyltransferase [Solirubrobacteraceae bacterium]|nr:SAM-dependent methyltransferase [Solirubrobacteraceae bacterium]
MSRMTLSDFEARYRADPDPWGYMTSAYERDKYAATLAACGAGPFDHALELGASIGVFSAMLAPRCLRLTTIDAAPTAVDIARRRLANTRAVAVLDGVIPGAIPDGPYDLVVASEILYYMTAGELDATLDRIGVQTTPGGRLVAVHWRPDGPDRPLTADDVHEALRRAAWLRPLDRADTDGYRLDVLERQ